MLLWVNKGNHSIIRLDSDNRMTEIGLKNDGIYSIIGFDSDNRMIFRFLKKMARASLRGPLNNKINIMKNTCIEVRVGADTARYVPTG